MTRLLRQLADIQLGYQPRGRMPADPAGSHRLIQIKDVDAEGRLALDELERIAPDRAPERYEVGAGDVLFIARGSRLAPVLVPVLPFPAVAISFFYILRPDREQVRPDFLAWSLAQPAAERHVREHARGTGMLLLPRSGIETMPVELPSMARQERIMQLVRLAARERDLLAAIQQRRAALAEAACHLAASTEPPLATTRG